MKKEKTRVIRNGRVVGRVYARMETAKRHAIRIGDVIETETPETMDCDGGWTPIVIVNGIGNFQNVYYS
jgi:hypothetical protein